jgi:hypothetical protein
VFRIGGKNVRHIDQDLLLQRNRKYLLLNRKDFLQAPKGKHLSLVPNKKNFPLVPNKKPFLLVLNKKPFLLVLNKKPFLLPNHKLSTTFSIEEVFLYDGGIEKIV